MISGPVSAIMTSSVTTAGKNDDLETWPDDDRDAHPAHARGGRRALHSIVSIGDVVKLRIDTLQSERDQLVGYIQQ